MKHPWMVVAALGLVACHSGDATGVKTVSGVPDHGTGTFTVAPLAVDALVNITALGNLNPPDHTTPSDHTYWNLTSGFGASPQLPVYAPASGVVSYIRGGSDYKIMVNVTNTFVYYLDHVVPSAGIDQGSRVNAGDRIATSSGRAAGIDFGLINMERPLANLLAPDRYPAETRYADNPIKYYAEPLRTQLYAKVNREGSEKDGRVDFDLAGTLQGNWFLESVPKDMSASGPAYWSQQLAFVFDVIAPTSARISIGGVIGTAAVYGVLAGPPFSSVTPQSGITAYRTAFQFGSSLPSQQTGTMLVQLVSPTQLKAEFTTNTNAPAAFTANARIYVR